MRTQVQGESVAVVAERGVAQVAMANRMRPAPVAAGATRRTSEAVGQHRVMDNVPLQGPGGPGAEAARAFMERPALAACGLCGHSVAGHRTQAGSLSLFCSSAGCACRLVGEASL